MIAIVDYGMGNLRSVQKALQRVGGDAKIIDQPGQLPEAEKIVLPGVGAFKDAIARVRDHGLAEPILAAVNDGTPLLGICLGFQMFFDVSYEDGEHTGLGIFPGKVRRFDFSDQPQADRLRVPQMGWNQIRWDRECPLLGDIPQGSYVYFAHSFYADPSDEAVILTRTDYGRDYCSSVWKDNVFGTQFHPEKSQSIGLQILSNFVKLWILALEGSLFAHGYLPRDRSS
ncbi:MAG: imidazole glycerol phosphate synthase subunit HisH [Phycisphaerae bacterium]